MAIFKTEICVGSAQDAVEAQRAGAERVELCSALSEGGLTPSYGQIAMARSLLTTTRLHVIIRPRRGDFCYSALDIECMKSDIAAARRLGADGIVIGCLTENGDVDTDAMRQLVDAAGTMSITFHRAFDMCRDMSEALEKIIGLGCHRVLTSGGCATAEKGIDTLRQLVKQAAGRIIIMPGCGISPDNIETIALRTSAQEFHFSAQRTIESPMLYRNPNATMAAPSADEYLLPAVDYGKIQQIRENLQQLETQII